MSEFTHLHVHTDYSILDGAGRISDYVAKAKADGQTALAVTDHGNMFAAYEFYHHCRKEGIKAIIGSEFYVSPKDISIKDKSNEERFHLILLAKNEKGYRNLLKLSSISFTKGFYFKPRVDHELLKKYSEGIVCLSACIAGEIPRLIYKNYLDGKKDLLDGVRETAKWFLETYGEGNYFIEIQRHFVDYYPRLESFDPNSKDAEGIRTEMIVNPQLIKLSKELNIPLVCTNDAHYLNEDDAEAQDILMSIGTGKTIKDEKRFKFFGTSFYLKTEEEMKKLFYDVPEAIKNTKVVEGICNLEIEYPGPILPKFPIPKEFKDDKEYLIDISQKGLIRRYGENPPKEYQERLEYELSVINKMDFQGYFLIVWDYVKYAKDHDIPVGPGRGSGAGSIVAYSMGITDIDPMKYGLMFERFLNPERISMPDFDIDFCAEKREKVIEYVTQKYGEENVSQICTFGTLKAKQCLTDVARVLDIPLSEVNAMKKLIIDDLSLEFDWLINGHTSKDGTVYSKNEDFIAYRDKGPEYKKLFEIFPCMPPE